MAVAPQGFHDVASKLWQGTPVAKLSEPCVRTVAGRAYYSAYLSTREALRAAYADPTYDVEHTPLATFMIGAGQPTLKLAGGMLKELREARELADYDLGVTMRHAAAEHLVDDALEIISLAATLRAEFKAALPARPLRR